MSVSQQVLDYENFVNLVQSEIPENNIKNILNDFLTENNHIDENINAINEWLKKDADSLNESTNFFSETRSGNILSSILECINDDNITLNKTLLVKNEILNYNSPINETIDENINETIELKSKKLNKLFLNKFDSLDIFN